MLLAGNFKASELMKLYIAERLNLNSTEAFLYFWPLCSEYNSKSNSCENEWRAYE